MGAGSGHWDAELFRREGHRMVEWIAEYLDGGPLTVCEEGKEPFQPEIEAVAAR